MLMDIAGTNIKTLRYRWHLPDAVRRRHWQPAVRRLQAWYRRSWARPSVCVGVFAHAPRPCPSPFGALLRRSSSCCSHTEPRRRQWDPVQLRCAGLAAALELPCCDRAARALLTTAANLDPNGTTWQSIGDVVGVRARCKPDPRPDPFRIGPCAPVHSQFALAGITLLLARTRGSTGARTSGDGGTNLGLFGTVVRCAG